MGDYEIVDVGYDHPEVRALVRRLWDDLTVRYAEDVVEVDGPDGADAFHAEVDAERTAAPLGAFLVARRDGRAVGCGALKPWAGDRTVGEIKRMYVDPAERGRGLARALLGRLVERAGRLGYRRLHLETGLRQPEAIALYESAGWTRIPPYGRYRDDALTVCFALDLVPGPAEVS